MPISPTRLGLPSARSAAKPPAAVMRESGPRMQEVPAVHGCVSGPWDWGDGDFMTATEPEQDGIAAPRRSGVISPARTSSGPGTSLDPPTWGMPLVNIVRPDRTGPSEVRSRIEVVLGMFNAVKAFPKK